jgi:hypothetical protein
MLAESRVKCIDQQNKATQAYHPIYKVEEGTCHGTDIDGSVIDCDVMPPENNI